MSEEKTFTHLNFKGSKVFFIPGEAYNNASYILCDWSGDIFFMIKVFIKNKKNKKIIDVEFDANLPKIMALYGHPLYPEHCLEMLRRIIDLKMLPKKEAMNDPQNIENVCDGIRTMFRYVERYAPWGHHHIYCLEGNII